MGISLEVWKSSCIILYSILGILSSKSRRTMTQNLYKISNRLLSVHVLQMFKKYLRIKLFAPCNLIFCLIKGRQYIKSKVHYRISKNKFSSRSKVKPGGMSYTFICPMHLRSTRSIVRVLLLHNYLGVKPALVASRDRIHFNFFLGTGRSTTLKIFLEAGWELENYVRVVFFRYFIISLKIYKSERIEIYQNSSFMSFMWNIIKQYQIDFSDDNFYWNYSFTGNWITFKFFWHLSVTKNILENIGNIFSIYMIQQLMFCFTLWVFKNTT